MIERLLASPIRHTLNRGKSVLLLGVRQTGKTTLAKSFQPNITINFSDRRERIAHEANPGLLIDRIEHYYKRHQQKPLVLIDEVQKIPAIMDSVQCLIDNHNGQFILSGSSARKLRRSKDLNMLPGRVIKYTMDPLCLPELPDYKKQLSELLYDGSLPEIISLDNKELAQELLSSYVDTYLAEEIEAEAAVRSLGSFTNFLQLSASEAGREINFSKMSQQLGISRVTAQSYYQILEDCLVVFRVPAYTHSTTRKRLSKANRYLYVDLGIRRLCAEENRQQPLEAQGRLFKQLIGLELIRLKHRLITPMKIYYWRDHNGIEVDYVIEYDGQLIPIQVKLTQHPQPRMTNHIKTFLQEYPQATQAYVVCNCLHPIQLANDIIALPWQELLTIFEGS